MEFSVGEIIALGDDKKEYICIEKINEKSCSYLYLISNFQPLEVLFAKATSSMGVLEIVSSQEEKEMLLKKFTEKIQSQNN